MIDEKVRRVLGELASQLDTPPDLTDLRFIRPTREQEIARLEQERKVLEHRQNLLQRVVQDLLSGRLEPPAIYRKPSVEESWVECVKRYFAALRRRLHFPKYKEYVARFERSQRASFDKGAPVLLLPDQINGMVSEPSALPPRRGGRMPSDSNVRRNKIIGKYNADGYSDLNICKALDAEKIPPLEKWSKERHGATTWVYFYNLGAHPVYRERIHRLIYRVCHP